VIDGRLRSGLLVRVETCDGGQADDDGGEHEEEKL
jgi:hypothetical protein